MLRSTVKAAYGNMMAFLSFQYHIAKRMYHSLVLQILIEGYINNNYTLQIILFM